jgi:hypothetical protein
VYILYSLYDYINVLKYIILNAFQELIQDNRRVVEELAEPDPCICANWSGRSG